MYTRSYDDGEEKQSFRRGEYTIPANYRGNAFTAEEPPVLTDTDAFFTEEPTLDTGSTEKATACETCESPVPADCDTTEKKESRGLLGGLISRIERGFDFDDLLLIGLIVLLIRENKDSCQKNDETVILLAILLLLGF